MNSNDTLDSWKSRATAAEARVAELEDIYFRCEAICSDGELGVTMESLRREITMQDSHISNLEQQLSDARHAMACPIDNCDRCAKAYADLFRAIDAIDAR